MASDPGSLRLRMAATTVGTVALALAVLAGLATLTGQPITVALLGVVIAMISSVAVNDPEPRQQVLTTVLLPLPAVAAVTLGALLAPYLFAGAASVRRRAGYRAAVRADRAGLGPRSHSARRRSS
ncbi:MAG: hypothetical protein ACRDRO_20415 [Pseudonocardiaceae bacterium]